MLFQVNLCKKNPTRLEPQAGAKKSIKGMGRGWKSSDRFEQKPNFHNINCLIFQSNG